MQQPQITILWTTHYYLPPNGTDVKHAAWMFDFYGEWWKRTNNQTVVNDWWITLTHLLLSGY